LVEPGEANSNVSAKAVHNSAEQNEVGRTALGQPAPWDVGTGASHPANLQSPAWRPQDGFACWTVKSL